jgi:predicted NBD/HSP70 family sugar kinase
VANIHVDDWVDVSIKELLREELGIPVFIEENSHLTALAEKRFGSALNSRNFLALNISAGIAMGICVDDHLYGGAQGRAGEIGHFQISSDGPLCSCGNKGCLESFAAVPAIIEQAREAIRKGVFSKMTRLVERNLNANDFDVVCEAARLKDKLAVRILRDAAGNIGQALGNAVNLLNPETIIINGEITAAGEDFLTILNQKVEEVVCQPDTCSKIIYSKLPWPKAVALGGAALALRKIFIEREINILEKSK